MTEQPPPQLRISEPAEIAQIIPYLVGFIPENSLVVSALQDGRVQVTARVDLADVQRNGRVEELLDRIWSRFPGADALAVAYTDDHLVGWDILSRCDARLPYGATTMLVDNDTWHTPDGISGTIDPAGYAATRAAYHGLQHLPSRRDLEARLASRPDSAELDQAATDALDALPQPGDARGILQLTGHLIDHNLPARDSSTPISVQDAIQLSVLMLHPGARDLALLRIDRDNAEQHLALWQSVIRNSPAFGSDMALFVAGMAAWISGDGASAAIALERALSAEPPSGGRNPAKLLEDLIDNVVPPSAWDKLRAHILEHTHPAVTQALSPAARSPRRPATPPLQRGRAPLPHRRPPKPGMSI